jgi:hypothetical protein
MRIDNRQYKFAHIRPKPAITSASIKGKKGRRCDSKLDRRGRK